MKGAINKVFASKFWWLLLLAGLFVINFLASQFHARFDLTKEKRYTLSKATRNLVKGLEDDVQIDVFLKGEFPSGFRKLANTTKEFLGLLKDINGSKVHYRFISPLDEMPDGKQWGDTLVKLGAVPINLTVQKKAGESSNIIFPVALVTYNNRQSLVNLYPGASGRISQEEINSAEALMEYQFVKTLDKITAEKRPAIAYAVGNGEPANERVYDLEQTLIKEYQFGPFDISKGAVPAKADVLMIVKPTAQFTEDERLKIDQFVMRGGKLLCFIDNLIAEQDSLAIKPETIAYDRNLNLTDLFFKYGLRINPDLVMDLQCDLIPMVVGGTMENPQFEFMHWNYHPILTAGNSSMNKGLGYVSSRFVNSIDTIASKGIKKTPLLVSSPNSRIISTPALISLNENRNAPEDEKFRQNAIPVAMLLEGKFTSLFRNRIMKAQLDSLAAQGISFKDESPDNKMIVVADGDIVLNDVLPNQGPIPMGFNKYTYSEYLNQGENGKYFLPTANRDFLLNCVEYLVNNPAISETRNKDIVLRLLDSKKVEAQKSTWQMINIALPVMLVILFGWLYQQLRKRKYAA
ncbi:MAG TPA: gliding motility-associated ABC transporter substrate-binding protein GldG [Chitinophagaceae bacterium]|jgi:gliding-associated putative ABC transporter substrate-binding component GldG|nr:gliding motility-associated ABC transporter substrate-binding protein GldG [Chitinophagaceae bacterium]HMU58570.1 gliding motility-associated ABC transporter substrate-binding protein GldG [Chitinophagaceae bacterium]